MNILVLNGSPKGDYSITLHTVLYLKELYPQDSFKILHVGQKIKPLKRTFPKPKQQLKKQMFCSFLILFIHLLHHIKCIVLLNL